MTEPGGAAPRRRWTGRHYVHLLLPVGYLTGPAVDLLDAAVAAADGWRVSAPDAALSRTWARTTGPGLLRLAVLGWYPLIVTVAADPGGGRAGRRALARLAEAARSVDGRPVPDAELPGRLVAAADRGTAAATLHRRAMRARTDLARRRCPACQAVSDRIATHCSGCDRRFTGTDDSSRDAANARAAEHLRYLAGELDRLARDRPMRATADQPPAVPDQPPGAADRGLVPPDRGLVPPDGDRTLADRERLPADRGRLPTDHDRAEGRAPADRDRFSPGPDRAPADRGGDRAPADGGRDRAPADRDPATPDRERHGAPADRDRSADDSERGAADRGGGPGGAGAGTDTSFPAADPATDGTDAGEVGDADPGPKGAG